MAPLRSSRHGTEPLTTCESERSAVPAASPAGLVLGGCADRHPDAGTVRKIENDSLRLKYLQPDFHMVPPVIVSVL
jgi:hypothetical protein